MRWRLLASLLAVSPAMAAESPGAAPAIVPSITVQGTCIASATPDRARMFAGAEVGGPDASRAAAAAITQYNRFKAEVEKLALSDATLTSSGVQTDRSTDERNGKIITTGYTARAGLTVETSSLPGLAHVMQLAATDGLANVGSMDLFLSEKLRHELEQSCLPKATADARDRATALLAGIGATLGDAITISTEGGERPMPKAVYAAPMSFARAAPVPQLSAGTQTVSVEVSVTFAIAQGRR